MGVGIPRSDLSLPTFPGKLSRPLPVPFVLLNFYPLTLQMTFVHLVCVGFASNIRLGVPQDRFCAPSLD